MYQHFLLDGVVLLRVLDSSKRRQLASADLLKVLHHDSLAIVAEHADHFLNLLGSMWLVEALEEKGEFFSSEASIVVDVDGVECLPEVFV